VYDAASWSELGLRNRTYMYEEEIWLSFPLHK